MSVPPCILGSVRTRSALKGLPAAGTAAVGVLVGHWLAYVVAFPSAAVRQHVLQDAGHSYWLNAIRVAVVMVVAGLAVVVGRHARGGGRGRARGHPQDETFASLSRQLAVVQVTAFTAMEVVERLASGTPLSHALDHQVFVLGVAAQVVVASIGALFLLWFGRAAASLAEALRRDAPVRPGAPALRPRSAAPRPVHALVGAAGVRGPPPR